MKTKERCTVNTNSSTQQVLLRFVTNIHNSSRPRLLPIKDASFELVELGRSRIPFLVTAKVTIVFADGDERELWPVGKTGDFRSIAERCADELTGQLLHRTKAGMS